MAMKVGCRFVLEEHGGLCVTTVGAPMMQELCVDSLDMSVQELQR